MEEIKKKVDQKTIATWIIVLGVIISFTIVYSQQGGISRNLSSQEAGEKVLNYVNDNLLQEGIEATLLSSEAQDRFLYKLELSVQGQTFEAYTTRDGKLLFLQPPINLDEPLPPSQ